MKLFATAVFIFMMVVSFGQSKSYNPLLSGKATITEQKVRTDSFSFAGLTYQIPRDCGKKYQGNCCSYRSDPDQFGCYNGTSLTWDYFQTEKIASDNVESTIRQWEAQYASFQKQPVTCYLMGNEVQGYVINYITKSGNKGHTIITSGTANGKVVLVELLSEKKLKNKDIQPVIRQIVRLKE